MVQEEAHPSPESGCGPDKDHHGRGSLASSASSLSSSSSSSLSSSWKSRILSPFRSGSGSASASGSRNRNASEPADPTPATVSFVVLCNPRRICHGANLYGNRSGGEKGGGEPEGPGAASPRVRHGRRKLSDLVGVRLARNEATKRFEVAQEPQEEPKAPEEPEAAPGSPLAEPARLLPGGLPAYLLPSEGDVLESIDGRPVHGRRCWDEEALYRAIVEKAESALAAQGDPPFVSVTLTFCRSGTALEDCGGPEPPLQPDERETEIETENDDDDEPEIEAETDAPGPEASRPLPLDACPAPIVHQVFLVDQTGRSISAVLGEREDHPFLRLDVCEPKAGRKPKRTTGPSRLRIRSVPESSWLSKQTRVRPGDLLLEVDGVPCGNGEIAPDETSLLWATALLKAAEGGSCPGISVASKAPTRVARIRRAAVTVGGGALVGTGAVLMATPLHPVGHAMALSGLGVLGTEFEAPRKAVAGLRSSFSKRRPSAAVGKSGGGGNDGGGGGEDHPCAEATAASTATASKDESEPAAAPSENA
ncbi:unnamed protein product [Pseudo-nitzschia multistriata]|uniref:PDZ domain-containing protein n=1 Tax=Pseudo-nitzschia multistriata TaxID=183589 RepID=A0A448Z0S2_9STRA|nr:unnamed protein product [Pseudo-nitzschia multistriata]